MQQIEDPMLHQSLGLTMMVVKNIKDAFKTEMYVFILSLL